MTSTSAPPVLIVLGAGPGLGMSVAHRFGAAGHRVALISRSAARHADYLRSLADAGVEAAAFTADADRPAQPARTPSSRPQPIRPHRRRLLRTRGVRPRLFGDITALDAAGAEAALRGVVPAVDFASLLIPELTERGSADCCSQAA